MAYQRWLVNLDQGILTLTINRPEVRNALDNLTWNELGQIVRDTAINPKVHVVIITGAEDKAFAAGADVPWLLERPAVESLDPGVQGVLLDLENLPQPTIAAVNGYALGGGCELALACDLRFASQNARFGLTELAVGIIPGGGGTQRLPRLVGAGLAKEMIFFGNMLDAEEAQRVGLVNRVYPLPDLLPSVRRMAQGLLQRPPLALRMAKQAINVGLNTDLRAGLAYEKACQTYLHTTEDRSEGMRAFIGKRKPNFRGK